MKKILFFCLAGLLSISVSAQTLSATGIHTEATPDAGLNVKKIYLFQTLSGASIIFDAENSNPITPYIYQDDPSSKTPLPSSDYTITGQRCTIINLQDGRGYFFDNGIASNNTVWVIDYSQHKPTLQSIEPETGYSSCNDLKLFINKTEDNLTYRGTGGATGMIKRKYIVRYNNLKWEDSDKTFIHDDGYFESEIGSEVIINKKLLTNTKFTLSDKFSEELSIPLQVSSSEYKAVATEAHISAERNGKDITNDLTTNFEGSAPIEISFYGITNPAAYFFTWKIFNSNDTGNEIARFTDKNFNYEFIHAGTYTVQLEVANNNSECIIEDKVTFSISESELDAPNFFSPGDSPGINDEFRVKYKSLVQFKCTIFNRWGVKIYEWTDPSKGWDGKHNGRYVAPGVYFYVIQAKGSEGKTYKKKGDINILRSK